MVTSGLSVTSCEFLVMSRMPNDWGFYLVPAVLYDLVRQFHSVLRNADTQRGLSWWPWRRQPLPRISIDWRQASQFCEPLTLILRRKLRENLIAVPVLENPRKFVPSSSPNCWGPLFTLQTLDMPIPESFRRSFWYLLSYPGYTGEKRKKTLCKKSTLSFHTCYLYLAIVLHWQ